MSAYEVNYRGSGVTVSQSESHVSDSTITQVRPERMNSGWMYLHSGERPWLTYHVQNVDSIRIEEDTLLMTDTKSVTLSIMTGYGEFLTIFLNGASLQMIADAIGCEQMAVQATDMAEELA